MVEKNLQTEPDVERVLSWWCIPVEAVMQEVERRKQEYGVNTKIVAWEMVNSKYDSTLFLILIAVLTGISSLLMTSILPHIAIIWTQCILISVILQWEFLKNLYVFEKHTKCNKNHDDPFFLSLDFLNDRKLS